MADTGTDPASVWLLTGSDNHNIYRKHLFLLVSQTMKNHPDWRNEAFGDGLLRIFFLPVLGKISIRFYSGKANFGFNEFVSRGMS